MGGTIHFSKTYHFRIAGQRVTLYKKNGESYEHVLMKALGHAMFRPRFPNLEIERRIGLRYKPDLVALNDLGRAEFWGECGQVGFCLFNFNPIVLKEVGEEFNEVAESWYERFEI